MLQQHASVFTPKKLDFKTEPLFFGSGKNIQEYADPKYPIFVKLDEEMESLFWRPSEVSLLKDRTDYKNLSQGEHTIYTLNLSYQILMDSVNGRSPLLAFLPVISNPELESCVITWGFFEKIHSKSYTYIIRNLYGDPNEILNPILDIPQIIDRAKSIGKYYDDFIELQQQWLSGRLLDADIKKLYTALYLALISVNILEGIRFYISFTCNFAFGENKVMEGSAKIMSLIARDESKHLSLTQHIIKILQSGTEGQIWVDIYNDTKDIVAEMYKDAVYQEKEWATYLCTRGSMLGLTEKSLHQSIDYWCNKRQRAINYPTTQPTSKNPFSWLDSWLNSKGLQEAPQETEKESYLVGKLNTDVSDSDFDDFKF